MQLSNYHSHCTFCDGRSIPEDFIKFALAKGFRAYGFSSHSPLPFETFWNMTADNMPDYLEEIDRLKNKYRDRIEIYTGLEIDYLDESYNASIPYFRQLPLDYRISSIHYIPVAPGMEEKNMACIDGGFDAFSQSVSLYFERSIRKLTLAYFQNSMKMVEAGGFDIVGHMDKIHMNGSRYPGFDASAPWYRDAMTEFLQLISEKGLMVEINTKTLVKKQQLFPREEYLPLIRKMNIPVLVNSDCHYPDLVDDGRSEAFDLLIKAGFKSTRELRNGKWEDVALI